MHAGACQGCGRSELTLQAWWVLAASRYYLVEDGVGGGRQERLPRPKKAAGAMASPREILHPASRPWVPVHSIAVRA